MSICPYFSAALGWKNHEYVDRDRESLCTRALVWKWRRAQVPSIAGSMHVSILGLLLLSDEEMEGR